MQQQIIQLPEITKNLIILNVLMFLATLTFPVLEDNLALYPLMSHHFQPYQIVTHMFMHGGATHIFFNMFALFMFGSELERVFGPKRFLFFYLLTGLGAAFLHSAVHYVEAAQVMQSLDPKTIDMILSDGRAMLFVESPYPSEAAFDFNVLVNMPAVGASGAVFGLLAGFGMLYPNRIIYLMIPPIPLKAKHFVLIYGAIELGLGLSHAQTGVAHFAHLGGAIFGFFIILVWRKQGARF